MSLLQKIRVVVFVLLIGCTVLVTGTLYQDTKTAYYNTFNGSEFKPFLLLSPSSEVWETVSWISIGLGVLAALVCIGNRWLLSAFACATLWVVAIYYTAMPDNHAVIWLGVVTFTISCMFAVELYSGSKAAGRMLIVLLPRTGKSRRETRRERAAVRLEPSS